MVVKGSYKSVEKVFLVASFIYLAYIVAGVLAHPDWKAAGMATLVPPNLHLFRSSSYLYMVIGVIGTTIAPWMQFYLQSSVVEKGITEKQYGASRLDVIVGCIFTDVVAWFIVVACAATLFVAGHHDLKDGAEAAQSLRPLAGKFAYILFSVGLFNASLFAASILPISTAYAVCEGLGFESGLDKKFSEAPILLLALHRPHRRRRRSHPLAQPAAGKDHHPLAGGQRRGAALRPHRHAPAHQQARTHGTPHQLALLQHRRLAHHDHHDRPDPDDALRHQRQLARIKSAHEGAPYLPVLGECGVVDLVLAVDLVFDLSFVLWSCFGLDLDLA